MNIPEKTGEKPHGAPETIAELSRQSREKINRGAASPSVLSAELSAALGAVEAEEMQAAKSGPQAPMQMMQDQEKAANIAGWKMAVVQVVPLVEAAIPEFKQFMQRGQWEEFGQALGEAAQHYGLGIGDALSHPLVKLAAASFPIAVAGYKIKQARIADATGGKVQFIGAPEKPQKVAEPEKQNPGSVTVPQHPGVTLKEMSADVPVPVVPA